MTTLTKRSSRTCWDLNQHQRPN